jgi:tRNA nucleotidyltransferase (CCA-adding enzyme)
MGTLVKPIDDLATAIWTAYPELETVREACVEPVYLVGGAVRDLLLGRGRADLDLVVVGDAAALATKLGAEVVEHERFATAKARLDGHEVDIASARAESYPQPGALPEVRPAADVEADLARRDFTINAIAIPLRGEPRLIDPYGGHADIEAGLLRVLHPRSFADDPTRALRAARYAARFGFELEPETARLLRDADLETVSFDRRESEMLRLAGEESAVRALELLDAWGLEKTQPRGIALARRVDDLLAAPPWQGVADREVALLAAARTSLGWEGGLPSDPPNRPSEGVALASRRRPVELVLARARGAEWLDRYLLEWRSVELAIDGEDLIAAGVPQGPAVGVGLAAALRGKLDGEVSGREAELEVALAAARAEGR